MTRFRDPTEPAKWEMPAHCATGGGNTGWARQTGKLPPSWGGEQPKPWEEVKLNA